MSTAEAEAVRDLDANLHGVMFNVEAWNAALELYRFAMSKPTNVDKHLARKWIFIASHECVMQLSYLQERLKVIRGHKINLCVTIKGDIDFKLLRDSKKLFDGYFPEIEELRHAVALAVYRRATVRVA